ncbi:hypothetical protein Patl1_32268 [Pistacia atlantica]|uniref:Uncharacterized protein n=1 Tax=Pistacia atlantica TaxID=434234 RepID=A0ACC1AMR0_9ROSI|nr:hypothetical protein Patl1_32268 [Pistacia atlantica]
MSSFSLLCFHNLQKSKVHEKVSESEPFVVPGLPDKIELTTNKLPGDFNPGLSEDFKTLGRKMREGDVGAYGVIVNSFEELGQDYVEGYRRATGKKVWCVGPVSLCNNENLDKAERGEKASNDEEKFGVLVKKEKIREVVDKVMNEEQGEEIKKGARRLAEKGKKAVEEGGSSFNNITWLIDDIIQQTRDHS